MCSIRWFPSYRIPKEDMDQFTVGNGFDAVKSSPHTETSQLWNLGLSPFSAEALSWRGSSKPATGGVIETGWALDAG